MENKNMSKNDLTYNIPIRYFDLDTNNHVNNSMFFTYMEEARTKLMFKEFLAFFDKGIGFVVTEAKCNYKKPIRIQDTVSIVISVENIKGISFDIKYLFTDPLGKLFAEGITRLACIDTNTQKLIRLPQEMINSLELLKN